jgi:hypothetical protein
MNSPLKAGIIILLAMVAIASFAGPLYYFFGDHKLTDGMALRKPQSAQYSISISSKHNLLYLKGPMEIGVVAALEKSLSQHSELKGIVLDSEGGNIYQARGIAAVIQKHLLNTYTSNYCYSACTIAYVAGRQRYLGPEAKLGFHRYRVDSRLMESLLDIEKEQSKDMAFYEQQISDREFTKKISDRQPPDIWIPTNEELLKGGVVHEILSDSIELDEDFVHILNLSFRPGMIEL